MQYLGNCQISTCAANQTAPSKVRHVDIEQKVFKLLKASLLLNVTPTIKSMLCLSPERCAMQFDVHEMGRSYLPEVLQ